MSEDGVVTALTSQCMLLKSNGRSDPRLWLTVLLPMDLWKATRDRSVKAAFRKRLPPRTRPGDVIKLDRARTQVMVVVELDLANLKLMLLSVCWISASFSACCR